MRNPKWHRDEIILALDLYFDPERGSIDYKNKKIIEVSQILNELPLFSKRPDAVRFRNANGVTLKLSNFLAFDETYTGKGMKGGSKLDHEVFNEFVNQQDKLHAIAKEIKLIARNSDLKHEIAKIEEDDLTRTDGVIEGEILYKLHKVRERDSKIIEEKKKYYYNQHGQLDCEACKFQFQPFYGNIGSGFIECHHKNPLFTLQAETKTMLNDLALVCSNCHRMLHRSREYLSIDDLAMMIYYEGLQHPSG
ncbi:MAG: HNH endonuclease [Chitinophagaceae bacterium]|nr:MAG: HNH endonuclease [Chitinophagaceae bacterium]